MPPMGVRLVIESPELIPNQRSAKDRIVMQRKGAFYRPKNQGHPEKV
jgi:hypothetical protein